MLALLSESTVSPATHASRPGVSLTGAVSAASSVCDAAVGWLVENLQLVVEVGDDPDSVAALREITYEIAREHD